MKTNEQAKQEAIKKAYGECYNEFKKYIDPKTGWCCVFKNNFHNQIESKIRMGLENDYWIPISIISINDNNGWIRIEPDGSNLPTTGNNFKVIFFDGKISDENQNLETINSLFKAGLITHYKLIEPELKPIY